MKAAIDEYWDLLIRCAILWPNSPTPGFYGCEYPHLGIELLRRAIDRGRPLTQEEVDAVFPEDWKPDDLTLIW
jgi:hypothetical protein